MNTFWLCSFDEPQLQERIRELNARAAKLGLPPITAQRTGNVVRVPPVTPREALRSGKRPHPGYEKVEIEIVGEPPILAGWQLVARIDHADSLGLVHTVPGADCPRTYWGCKPYCDHCQTTRKRNDTFIVRHESGSYKQVGRNCLADFLGHIDPRVLAETLQFYADLGGLPELLTIQADAEDLFCDRCAQNPEWPIETVLEYTSAVFRLDGWISRTEAEQRFSVRPTADIVRELLGPPRREFRTPEWLQWATERQPGEMDEQRAYDALEWLKKQPADSNYLFNLQTLAGVGICRGQDLGYVCSLIAAHDRDFARKRKEAAQLNEHFGKIGERLRELELTVTRIHLHEGLYGTTEIITFQDAAGRYFTWFTGKETHLCQQDQVRLTGTVKKHDDYQGRMQTVLTRCRYERAECAV